MRIITLYTVSQKLCHYTFVHKFDKCWPIFKKKFIVIFPKKFATQLMPLCPPHLRYVAALPVYLKI